MKVHFIFNDERILSLLLYVLKFTWHVYISVNRMYHVVVSQVNDKLPGTHI